MIGSPYGRTRRINHILISFLFLRARIRRSPFSFGKLLQFKRLAEVENEENGIVLNV